MKKFVLFLMITAVVLFFVYPLAAQEGFVSLFNGNDLSGWVEEGASGAFVARDGELILDSPKNYPSWLRSDKEYENFELHLEYMVEGWTEAGIFLHAPLHGRASRAGMKIHLRHDQIEEGARSTGAIYDVLEPLVIANKKSGEWNKLKICLNWPFLKVSMNGTVIHDTDMSSHPDLKWRLRKGYLGFQDINCGIHYRNIRIRELPGSEKWKYLYNGKDLSGWTVQGDAEWFAEGEKVVSTGGNGFLISEEEFSSYVFQTYVKSSHYANGGLNIRWGSGDRDRGYEIQIYSVPDVTNQTGSIYGFVPADRLVCGDEEWYLLEVVSTGSYIAARVNGWLVAESHKMDLPDEGNVALQMHQNGARLEFKDVRIKPLAN